LSEKLPVLSWREVVRALGKVGFRIVHQRGSHLYLTDGKHKITVPRHDAIKRGTLFSIIHQAGLTKEEFLKLLSNCD
jgi:predicted RNA binding protein YcfA (HicA-like mRNA interferase family)